MGGYMQRMLACGLAALVVAGLSGRSEAAGGFGSKEPHLFNLKGTLYVLPEGTDRMPEDLEKQKAEGEIFTDTLDIPPRDFKEGFPGVSERFEWFGIIYKGTFQVTEPGEYGWKLGSDDGAILWIDGQRVIDTDWVHSFEEREGSVNLTKGPHELKVWFFQGPATQLGLQLWVTPPGAGQRIFSMKEFSGDVGGALSRVQGQATREGIRVSMDATVLFGSAKSDLKPEAKATLADVGKIIAGYPGSTVRIDGHTDSQGDAASNLKLSEARAKAVKTALAALRELKGVTFKTAGYGKDQPVADNTTAAGRARNRRVDITIIPRD